MLLTFLGANHEVTGSRTMLEWRSGHYALVDCGEEQGVDIYASAPMPVPAASVELVLLTHAHIDHTGQLPRLYRDGFRGRVLCTPETAHLCRVMLLDSAHIKETDAAYQTKKNRRSGLPPVEPDYTAEDVEGLMELFRPCRYGEVCHAADGLDVCFTDQGHLLGSSAITCRMEEDGVRRTMVFSGDVGNTGQAIIRDPQPVKEADYLMIESTYGDRLHDRRIDPIPMLTDVIQRTLDRGGNVLIPSFAVGRTQELLYFIREIRQRGLIHGHDGFPVCVDSPLANEATAIFLHCDIACLDDDAAALVREGRNPIDFPGLRTVNTTDESKALNADKTPKVIIASSGMCDAGRIRHHLKYNLWRRECTLLFVGYQSNGTLGRIIYDGAKKVKLLGEEIDVACEVQLLAGVSGHADRDGLLRWVEGFERKPGMVFVNHGDDGASANLAALLGEKLGLAAEVPWSGSVFDLASGVWVHRAEAVPVRKEKPVRVKKSADSEEKQAFLQLIRDMLKAAEKARTITDKQYRRLARKLASILDDLRGA